MAYSASVSSMADPLLQAANANAAAQRSQADLTSSDAASNADFNSHMDAASQESESSQAVAPQSAAPAAPAPQAPAQPDQHDSKKDAAHSDASDGSADDSTPHKGKTVSSSSTPTPDASQSMNQIIASSIAPTVPATATATTSASASTDGSSADSAASVTTSAAALFTAATAADINAAATTPSPSSSPSGKATSKTAASLLSSASTTTASSTGENNAATTLLTGIKVPVATVSGTVTAARDAQNQDSSGANGSNSEKKDPNSQNSTLSSAQDSLSNNLGTVFSGLTNMPAIAQNLPIAVTADKSIGTALDALAPLTPVRSQTTSATAAAPADASLTATAAASLNAAIDGTSLQSGMTEKSVVLDSNQQFIDVIKQALDQQPLQTPQRIAVELQTPPGQTVTVFFSQSNGGQIRAQLSASDSGSLQWLQQQVSSLKEINGGSTIVWLPPQLDHSNSDNGQGRSGHQAQQSPQQQPQQNGGNDADMDDRALAEAIFGGADLNATLT